jgi:hypothetical protein
MNLSRANKGKFFTFRGYDGSAGPNHNTAWIYKRKVEVKKL